MDDRTLLELAAKAANIGGKWDWPRGAKAPIFWRDASGKAWQPLTDDGDALRLAVRLRMSVAHTGNTADVETRSGIVSESRLSDPYAATRRAVVRAAAEIGRGMK